MECRPGFILDNFDLTVAVLNAPAFSRWPPSGRRIRRLPINWDVSMSRWNRVDSDVLLGVFCSLPTLLGGVNLWYKGVDLRDRLVVELIPALIARESSDRRVDTNCTAPYLTSKTCAS